MEKVWKMIERKNIRIRRKLDNEVAMIIKTFIIHVNFAQRFSLLKMCCYN